MKKTLVFIIVFTHFTIISLLGQNASVMSIFKDSLKAKSERLYTLQYDQDKYQLNNEICKTLEKALKQEKSFEYSFDSLKYISELTSEDNKLKVFTWLLPKENGTFEYFGYVQSYDENISVYKYWPLKDKSEELTKPETKTLSANNWYGAHYYQLITTKYNGKKYYTVLGWDGNNYLSRKKIIDVITLKKNGEPVFGFNLFSTKDLKYIKEPIGKRIIFEYSAQTRMYMDYEQQHVVEKISSKKQKNKRAKKTSGFVARKKEINSSVKEKTYASWMIIFDRLAPNNKELEGIYQFYFPETNIMDGLVFVSGKWKYFQEIDARNPADPKQIKKRAINYNLF